MKYKILLKSFLLFALIFTFSSFAQASEVTGSLSSTGVINGQSGGGSSGSGSGTSGGTSQSRSNGSLVSVVPALSAPALTTNSTSSFSSDGTAFGPGTNNLAMEDSAPAPTTVTPTTSPLVATALGGFGDFSATSWFWIVLLLLLLIAFIVYIYRRPLDKNKAVRV